MYEMLAGEPPFTGTPATVLAKRAAMTAPPVRILRSTVPEAMEAAVARALAREPADRYATAGEFAQALRVSLEAGAAPSLPVSRRASRRPWVIAGVLVATVAAITTAWVAGHSEAGPVTAALQRLGIVAPTLDTLAYVVVADVPADASTPDVAEPMRNGLRRWRDLVVTDGPTIAQVAARRPADALPEREGRRIALSLGAGRYLRMSVGRLAGVDSLDVSADLFETRSGGRLAGARVRIASGRPVPVEAMESLGLSVLFRGQMPRVARAEGRARTPSLTAREAFLRGQLALENGNFAQADSEFLKATRADAKYAQALVWLANTRSWKVTNLSWAQLSDQAAQAVAERGPLATEDSLLLGALRALAAHRDDDACRLWSRLTVVAPYDFAAWYSLGNCLRRDRVVVRDPSQPARWRFRSSYELAVRAYEQAFQLQPAVLQGFGGRSLANLQAIFYTSGASGRLGRAVSPDSQTFLGFPVWERDSITVIPVELTAAGAAPLPNAVAVALQHQRERFRAVARLWRTEFPRSADAAEATAVALEMLGDPASLDTLQRARALATDPDDRLRIAATEVFFRVKFSVPSDLTGLRAARELADSLLDAQPPAEHVEPQLLGSLAALTGRASLAASYAIAGGMGDTVPALAQSGPALVAFAALGGPSDSLRSLEQRVEDGVNSLPEAARGGARSRLLVRAAVLAFPNYRLGVLSQAPQTTTSPHFSVAAAASVGDSVAVRRVLAQLATARRSLRPADIMIDGVFPESAALFAIGDARGAVAWLDPTLRTLRFSASQDLTTVARAGALVRAMALRADLATRLDDTLTARRWAGAVVALWSGADPFLRPVVQRMQTHLR
jgi:tetratricopeptide (TPR) repeat protein